MSEAREAHLAEGGGGKGFLIATLPGNAWLLGGTSHLPRRLPANISLMPEPLGHLGWHCHVAPLPQFPGDRARGRAEGSSLCNRVACGWGS